MEKLLSLLFVLFFAIQAFADGPAQSTQSVNGKAKIIAPITLSKDRDLDFGLLAKGTGSSTVTIGAVEDPSPSTTGDITVITSYDQLSAKFTVTGESLKSYKITLPTSINITYSGTNLLVNAFTCSNTNGGTWGGIIGTGDTFYVGATLNVTESAPPGLYTGTFSVTVQYD